MFVSTLPFQDPTCVISLGTLFILFKSWATFADRKEASIFLELYEGPIGQKILSDESIWHFSSLSKI